MSVLATILFGLIFFTSFFVVGQSGNIYYFVSMAFVWVLVCGIMLRLKNQLNDPVDNVYLKKEIILQLFIILITVLSNELLNVFNIITNDIYIITRVLSLISCGFLVVDSVTFFKNKKTHD